MLDLLTQAKAALPVLLRQPVGDWNSLDVDYEPPRVERLWWPFGGQYRLMLHRIHPCTEALWHPHPWPSAVEVVEEAYEMGVSYHGPEEPLVTMVLKAGSSYEMLNPKAWHYVRPLEKPSLSIMVIGQPYEKQVYDHSNYGKNRDLKPLTDEAKLDLVKAFQKHFA